jgi:hypothetical protein
LPATNFNIRVYQAKTLKEQVEQEEGKVEVKYNNINGTCSH